MKKKPEYITVYEKYRADIISGAYPFGSKLPSKRVTLTSTTGYPARMPAIMAP